MFEGSNFKQNLSKWNISNVKLLYEMFKNSKITKQDVLEWGWELPKGILIDDLF